MPLTTKQQATVEVLEWLLDPTENVRRSGRTLALTVALIRLAIRHPNQWIPLTDHHFTSWSTTQIGYGIEYTVRDEEALRHLGWEFRRGQIRTTVEDSRLVNWEPSRNIPRLNPVTNDPFPSQVPFPSNPVPEAWLPPTPFREPPPPEENKTENVTSWSDFLTNGVL